MPYNTNLRNKNTNFAQKDIFLTNGI